MTSVASHRNESSAYFTLWNRLPASRTNLLTILCYYINSRACRMQCSRMRQSFDYFALWCDNFCLFEMHCHPFHHHIIMEYDEQFPQAVQEAQDDLKEDGPPEWISYWKPNVTINLVDDFTRYAYLTSNFLELWFE